MSSKEAYVAIELNRARGSNFDDSNLAAVIADYFALEDPEASSNDGKSPAFECCLHLLTAVSVICIDHLQGLPVI